LRIVERDRFQEGLVIAAILAVTGTIFGWGIASEAIWMDEAATLRAIDGRLWDVLSQSRHYENTPPLYYIVLWGWTRIVGTESDTLIRVPALFFAMLGVLAAYRLFRYTAPESIGPAASAADVRTSAAESSGPIALIACALLSTSWMITYYAREARAYSLLLLLSIATILAALRFREQPTATRATLFIFAATAGWYTHFSFLWTLLAVQPLVLFKRDARLGWFLSNLAVGVLCLPTVPWVLRGAGRLPGATPRDLPHFLEALHDAYLDYAGGTALAILLAALSLFALSRWTAQRGLLLTLAVLPVVGPLVIWLFGGPVFFSRHGIVALVGIFSLASIGTHQLWRTLRVRGARQAVAMVFLGVWTYTFVESHHKHLSKPPVDQAARFVAKRARPDDLVLVTMMMDGWAFQRYYERTDTRRRNYDEFTVEGVARTTPDLQRIWLVLVHPVHPDSVIFGNSPLAVQGEWTFEKIRVFLLEKP
jgi:hypothetical protein